MTTLANLEKGHKAEIISFLSRKHHNIELANEYIPTVLIKESHEENQRLHTQGHNHRHRNKHNEKSISRLESLGIRKGRIVKMIINANHGPIVIKIDGTRVAVGRGMAEKVMVKRI